MKELLSKAQEEERIEIRGKLSQTDDGIDSDSSVLSLSITPTICYLEESEWILDTSAIYHVCLKRE